MRRIPCILSLLVVALFCGCGNSPTDSDPDPISAADKPQTGADLLLLKTNFPYLAFALNQGMGLMDVRGDRQSRSKVPVECPGDLDTGFGVKAGGGGQQKEVIRSRDGSGGCVDLSKSSRLSVLTSTGSVLFGNGVGTSWNCRLDETVSVTSVTLAASGSASLSTTGFQLQIDSISGSSSGTFGSLAGSPTAVIRFQNGLYRTDRASISTEGIFWGQTWTKARIFRGNLLAGHLVTNMDGTLTVTDVDGNAI